MTRTHPPETGLPVAVFAGFAGHGTYTGMVAGLDDAYQSKSAYRQLLWQVVRRAQAHGARRLALGVDADFEKQRLGARNHSQCVYLQASDHYGGAVLDEIAKEVSLELPTLQRTG